MARVIDSTHPIIEGLEKQPDDRTFEEFMMKNFDHCKSSMLNEESPILSDFHSFASLYVAHTWTFKGFIDYEMKKPREIFFRPFSFLGSPWIVAMKLQKMPRNDMRLEVIFVKEPSPVSDLKIKWRSSLLDKYKLRRQVKEDEMRNSKSRCCGILDVKRSLFRDNSYASLVSDGSLVICLEATGKDFFPCQAFWKNYGGNGPFKSESLLLGLSNSLTALLGNEEKADVILKVGDESIPAHKLILAARSKVFASKLKEEMKEGSKLTLSLDDTDVSDIRYLLSFIYTGKTPLLSLPKIYGVYTAAEKYGVFDLKNWCSSKITQSITTDCVLDVLLFAEKSANNEIKYNAIDYIISKERFFRGEKWKEFVKTHHVLSLEIMNMLVAESLFDGSDIENEENEMDFEPSG